MNTSYEKLSFYNTVFGGSIDGDNILSTDFYGNKTIVGVTLKKYNETLELLNSYYDKLVEVGVIEKEKSPEDVAKEQQELMKSMIEEMKQMKSTIDTLKEQQKGEKNEYRHFEKRTNEKTESSTAGEFESVNRKGKGTFKFSGKSDRGFEQSKNGSFVPEQSKAVFE